MKSRLLIVAAVLAISQSVYAMERENPGLPSSFGPLSTTIVITAVTATAFYKAYNLQTRQNGEILLTVDDEQLAALKENNVLARLRNLMAALCKKLALYYAESSTTPLSDLASLHTMGGIVYRIRDATVHAARNAVWEAFRDARVEGYAPWGASGVIARGAALNAAGEAALNAMKGAIWSVAYDTASKNAFQAGRDTRYKVGRDAAYNAALKALARGATLKEVDQMAYLAAEGAILAWLLDNIEMVIEAVYPPVLEALGNSPANNPFDSNAALISFVNQHFGSLEKEAMLFLAPWLVLIVPINAVPEIHRRLFIDLRMISVWPQASQLLLAENDSASPLQILPPEVVGLILSNLIEIMFPQPR